MDIFSLGLLCFWVVFVNSLKNGAETQMPLVETPYHPSLQCLEEWKRKGILFHTARNFVTKGVPPTESQYQENLLAFFDQTLRHDPRLREVDGAALLSILSGKECVGPCRRNI
jgi:hypothetical protein